MRLLKNLIIASNVAAGEDPRTSYCDLDDLVLPDHAEKWDCAGVIGNFIPTDTKCYLKCDAGFIATPCE